jgi:hypothetical protein
MAEGSVKGDQVSVERSVVGLVRGQTTTLTQSASVVAFDTGTTHIKQGAAVAAGSWGDMSITMGACVAAVARRNVSIERGYGQWLIGAGDMTVKQGGAMTMMAGKSISVTQGGAALMLTQSARVEHGNVGLLISGRTELADGSRVILRPAGAAALGGALAGVLALLCLLFGRRMCRSCRAASD